MHRFLLKWLFIAISIAVLFMWYQQKHPTCDHSWYRETETKLSCQEKEVLYECIRCDETKTEIIRRENHNKVYTVVTEATCTEFGLHHIECTDCDFVDDSITPPRCKPGEYTVTKKPGIFTEGEEKTNCTVCGKKLTRSIWPIGTSESSPYEMKADEF